MYLVFDVGGTFVKYAIMTEKGEIIEKHKVPTPNHGTEEEPMKPYSMDPEEAIENFLNEIEIIYGAYSKKYDIEGIAMGLPGQINVEHGIVYGGGGLPYLNKAPLGDLISRRCDSVPVALENDGKCAALSEVWLGNASDCKDACVLVFGTGVGGGIVIDRKIHHGVGMIAGEMSFIYDGLQKDHLDMLIPFEERPNSKDFRLPLCLWTMHASVHSLRRRVGDVKGIPWQNVTGEEIYDMAESGDEEVINILDDMYFNIAWHCCNLYITLAPEIILIGGGISAQPKFFEGIVKYVNKMRRISHVYDRMKLSTCKFGNDSNLIGALFNFLQKYDKAQ